MKSLNTSFYQTDKSTLYLRSYEKYFKHMFENLDSDIKLFELGVHKGGSLLMWKDYFKNGTIVGLDTEPCQVDDQSGRVHIYQGFQQDCTLLDRIRNETAQDGFDVIIDDASHIGKLSKISFWHLFENHLKDGGLYVIEDWSTGYWDDWPDGKKYRSESLGNNLIKILMTRLLPRKKRATYLSNFSSHSYGLVGVVKQLIDELGMDAITDPFHNGIKPPRYSRFRHMEINPGQVFIVKANEEDNALLSSHLNAYWSGLNNE